MSLLDCVVRYLLVYLYFVKQSGAIISIAKYFNFKLLKLLNCNMVIKVLLSTFKIKVNRYDIYKNIAYEFIINFS